MEAWFYHQDNDGFISKGDMRGILMDCLAANEVIITSEEVDRLVNATFAKYPGAASGRIDFNTFKAISSKKQ